MKFKRQQPIGGYIVDFVCFEARLVIEVDGGQHQDCEADRMRDAWLASQGFKILRFWDHEVLTESAAVLERIIALLPPLSHEGRGENKDRRRDMRCSATIAILLAMTPIAGYSHPGHPAASLVHAHTVFGIDPIYTLLLATAGVAGVAFLWAHRRRVMSKAR